MLQVDHSAILSTFIKLPFVIKIFVLSIFECPFYRGITVQFTHRYRVCAIYRTPLGCYLTLIRSEQFIYTVRSSEFKLLWNNGFFHTGFDTINLAWSIVYIEGSPVIISK